ncbi:MAG: DNA-directed RNA polymerase subunit alpha [Thermoguttaceae bacterium]|nr:DNA-directed RNA polymerase subunit alpha [Thermoguttaceae bacterium]
MRIRWRGLELPSNVVCDRAACTQTYGRFYAEPFERGFGTTIGNSLRRVLLSSLEGSAVTRMKIRGVQLEFASIPGVMEDVTEIALNVKSLVVRSYDDKQHVLRIEKNTRGVVTAADIIPDADVEIINPELVIATLTDDVPFILEMVVENGRGYVPASEQVASRDRNEEIGLIPLDASFSPVVKVQYNVEETRVGQKTNYESLTMQIWTDGSLTPEMALVEASKILRKYLNPFVQYNRLEGAVFSRAKNAAGDGVDPQLESKLSMKLEDLHLSARAMNCISGEGITTVRDLVSRTEDSLLDVKNFGETTLKDIKEKLGQIGLRLGMRLPAPPSQGSNF